MAKHMLVVFTNPVEGQEEKYNTWYDETHVPDLLRIPGVTSARRLELAAVQIAELPAPEHKYLALYEIDGDPGAVMEELNRGVGSGEIALSDALDSAGIKVSVYTFRDQDGG
jgi:hypothetical protein